MVKCVGAFVPTSPTRVGIQSSGEERLSQSFTSVALGSSPIIGHLENIHTVCPNQLSLCPAVIRGRLRGRARCTPGLRSPAWQSDLSGDSYASEQQPM
jgi:hypothetical protein